MTDTSEHVTGVILAGGQARRMGGGDKFLRLLGGRSLLEHVIERAAPQTETLILNANGDPDRLAGFGLPIVPDCIEGQAGPLAGILTGLEWMAREKADCHWLASFAADTPFVPWDLVPRMLDAVRRDGSRLAVAMSGGRTHPVIGLWSAELAEDLRHALTVEDIRKIDRWTARYTLSKVDFDAKPVDPFFNANRPEDLEQAETLLSEMLS